MEQQNPPPPRAARARQSGFTLVELMVVIVILGGLVALVGPGVWNALFQANEETARTQMRNIGSAIDQYKAMHRGKLPQGLEELTQENPKTGEPWIDQIPDDPWGGRYEYRRETSRKYRLISAGEDEQFDTEDDIIWPETEKD